MMTAGMSLATTDVEHSVNFNNLLRAATMALRALGPYALLELVMPGGTLLALLLYLYRRRSRRDGCTEVRPKRLLVVSLARPAA
jgi:hypothetical protein